MLEAWSSWSLMAIVNESATKSQLSEAPHDEVALYSTTTTTTAAATTEPTTVVEPVNPNPLPSPFDHTTQNNNSFQIDNNNNNNNNNNASDQNNNLFQNLLISSPIINASENNNSFQNPLISNELNAINKNSFESQSFIMPNNSPGLPLLPASGSNGKNACGHTFANLFQSISIPPLFNSIPNPNPMPIEPLQDFAPVPDNVNDVSIFRNGLQQVQPANKFLLPKRDSYLFKPTTQKKRKYLKKTVKIMTLKELLGGNDRWAWRKYGRKPIKGTPHPRNYYKCSSLKSCVAKKQVERNPADLNTYIVTYTGEHHHSLPRYRNNGKHRLKLYLSDSDLDDEDLEDLETPPSPTNIPVDDHQKMDMIDPPGSGSRSEFDPNLIVLDDIDWDIPADEGADGGVEGNNELGTNSESPISILLADMGLDSEKAENVVLTDNACDFNNAGESEYRYGYGFEETDPNMNMEIDDFELGCFDGYDIPDFDFLFNMG